MKRLGTGIIALLLTVCLLGGCGQPQTISVGVTQLRVGAFSSGYATVGVVKPETQVDIVAKYPGTARQTYKEVGDMVHTGEVLVQLDTTTITNQIKSAQATLDQTTVTVAQAKLKYQTDLDNAKISNDTNQIALKQAQTDYDNAKTLFDANAVSQSSLDASKLALDKAKSAAETSQTAVETAQKNLDIYIAGQSGAAVSGAQAAVNASQTQLDNLKSQLADYTIKSPLDGIIISKNAVAGGAVGQTPVYTVADINRVIVSTAVPKEEINKLSLGGRVQVFRADNPAADNAAVETKITAIANSANGANLYMVQVTIENKEHYFKPGMSANMVFVEKQDQSAIVPFASVISAGKDNYIFIAENNQAKKVPVKVLGKNTNEISIEPIGAKLNEKTMVITDNANLLKDGDQIKVHQ